MRLSQNKHEARQHNKLRSSHLTADAGGTWTNIDCRIVRQGMSVHWRIETDSLRVAVGLLTAYLSRIMKSIDN